MAYTRLKWLLAAIPIPWAFSDEFYTIRRVNEDECHPQLNPSYPSISSWLEDDYVLIKRTSESSPFKELKGHLVLLRDPQDRTRTVLRRLAAVEGDWVTKSEFFRMMVPMGHGYLQGVKEDEIEQVPLALIEGVVTHVIWPPIRRRELVAQAFE